MPLPLENVRPQILITKHEPVLNLWYGKNAWPFLTRLVQNSYCCEKAPKIVAKSTWSKCFAGQPLVIID